MVPEGSAEPIGVCADAALAWQLVIFVLAAPGLFGWPFARPGWTPPDPLTVPLHTLATPEYFQAVDSLGSGHVTHSPGISMPPLRAEVECVSSVSGVRICPRHTIAANRTMTSPHCCEPLAPLVNEVRPALDGPQAT